MGLLQLMDPYIGKYYSMEWARKNVLHLDEKEIKEIDKQIEDEKDQMLANAEMQGQSTIGYAATYNGCASRTATTGFATATGCTTSARSGVLLINKKQMLKQNKMLGKIRIHNRVKGKLPN
jgi:hypothetical protein